MRAPPGSPRSRHRRQKLVKDGALRLSLFDEHNLAEIACDDYPDERLVVCRNPFVAKERSRKCDDLLATTERALDAPEVVCAYKQQKEVERAFGR